MNLASRPKQGPATSAAVALLDSTIQELAGNNTNNTHGASTGANLRQRQDELHCSAATYCAVPARHTAFE